MQTTETGVKLAACTMRLCNAKNPTCIEDGETIMVCLEKKHTVNTGYLFGNNIADCHAYDPEQTHAFKNKQTKYTEQDKSRNGKLGKPKFM